MSLVLSAFGITNWSCWFPTITRHAPVHMCKCFSCILRVLRTLKTSDHAEGREMCCSSLLPQGLAEFGGSDTGLDWVVSLIPSAVLCWRSSTLCGVSVTVQGYGSSLWH